MHTWMIGGICFLTHVCGNSCFDSKEHNVIIIIIIIIIVVVVVVVTNCTKY
jgi:hypothetical protein